MADRVPLRTLRLALGARLLSLASDGSVECAALTDALDSAPQGDAIVLNLDGMDPAHGRRLATAMSSSTRVRTSARQVIVVCSDPAVLWVLERKGADRLVVVEPTLEDALRHVVGRHWLATMAELGGYASTSP